MSASPARPIRTVEAYTNPAGEARCKVTLESGEVVALASLSRPELLKAAKIAFPEVSGKAWFSADGDKIRQAIRTNHVPDDLTLPKAPKAPEATPEAPKAPEAPEEPKAREQAPSTGDAASDLADAISRLIPPSAPAVDEAQVRAIVEAHVEHVLIEHPVVRVEVAGAEVKTLPKAAHKALPEVVAILGAGLHLFLVGPAGSGKSTLAHQAAEAITTEAHPDGLPFHALSLGPTTPTSKLFGYNDANGVYRSTPFREVYENGGVFLLDELDNGHPGLVAELNQALANGYGAFADGLVKRHQDCRIVATGNTFGKGPDRLFVGRNILDAATLDRFVTVEVLVDEALERNLALGYADEASTDAIRQYVALVQSVRKSVTKAGLPLVVSPRASIDGARLIRAGISPERVAEIRLFAGWSTENRNKAGV